MKASDVRAALRSEADPEKAAHSRKFFKAAPGGYGEGDRFHGIKVPVQRKIARQFKALPLRQAFKLLESGFHEERLVALFILVDQFRRGDEAQQKKIYEGYLERAAYVNNWDLVDSSAHLIVGPWLEGRSKKVLLKLGKSRQLWKRRMAMVATYHFIRLDEFDDAIRIAELLVHDEHDLIHKAVGWMLREIGNRDRPTEERFLDQYAATMPRIMLRYALEKFPKSRREHYMKQDSL